MGPCAGACLRAKIAEKKGANENFWIGCLYWWFCSCCALCQETVQSGTMEMYIPNAISDVERGAKSSIKK